MTGPKPCTDYLRVVLRTARLAGASGLLKKPWMKPLTLVATVLPVSTATTVALLTTRRVDWPANTADLVLFMIIPYD